MMEKKKNPILFLFFFLNILGLKVKKMSLKKNKLKKNKMGSRFLIFFFVFSVF